MNFDTFSPEKVFVPFITEKNDLFKKSDDINVFHGIC
jgi:hypothetical protein